MKKEIFFHALLPLGVVLGGFSSCTKALDVSEYLNFECKANQGKGVTHQSIEMIPGQEINIGGQLFNLTERGRLRFKSGPYTKNALEIGPNDFIITGLNLFDTQRYTVTLDYEGVDNKTKVGVSLNCSNPAAD